MGYSHGRFARAILQSKAISVNLIYSSSSVTRNVGIVEYSYLQSSVALRYFKMEKCTHKRRSSYLCTVVIPSAYPLPKMARVRGEPLTIYEYCRLIEKLELD